MCNYLSRTFEVHAKKNDDRLWPIIMAREPIIVAHDRISETKKTTIGKTSLIVGHLCAKKNDDNIVGTHDRQ